MNLRFCAECRIVVTEELIGEYNKLEILCLIGKVLSAKELIGEIGYL